MFVRGENYMKNKFKFSWFRFRIGFYVGLMLILLSCNLYIYWPQDYKQKISVGPPKIRHPIKDLTKVIQKLQPKIDPTTAKEIANSVEKYSEQYNFPPELIVAIINQESTFKSLATSSANCVGLMQINAKMHKEKLTKLNIKGDQIFHIDNNIHVGCLILKEYYDSTQTISGALKRYLGANNKGYLLAILSNFADLVINQK
jgi:hypothetical protein